MSRRSSARTTTVVDPVSHIQPTLPPVVPPLSDELTTLRTQWKWAAFSQFFFTFYPLHNLDDVSINDIESDLVNDNNIVLPRVMQKLLYTLSYDRKVSLDNWQTTLRKQYNKRDPFANPIGPEPYTGPKPSRFSSFVESTASPEPETAAETEEDKADPSPNDPEAVKNETSAPQSVRESSVAEEETKDVTNITEDVALPPSKLKKIYGNLDEAQIAELESRETKNWLDLPMLEKLDSMHLLTEWEFQNSARLRTLMKSDDEMAAWRIEPIGYDAKRNAYWLIGADRLWIQRVPPKPPRAPKNLKRKRPAANNTKGKAAAAKSGRNAGSSKRQRVEPVASPSKKGKGGKQAAGKAKAKVDETVASTSGRGSRAAKAQANIKLDAQAKQLAELNRQAALLARTESGASRSSKRQAGPAANGTGKTPVARALGTRLSSRLRGAQDEEWQPIPDEWLDGGAKSSPTRSSPRKGPLKTGLESDEESSDLSELTEESEEADGKSDASEDREDQPEEEAEPDEPEQIEEPPLPEGFVEWETIAVTLHEWDHIAERWEKATHYSEKALYKVLTHTIVPLITEELREIDRRRRLEEAIVHRKRSSRIAIKESAKEEEKAAARKKVEEDEKMSRARRMELRMQKEEAESERKESAREQRRKDREAREAREAEEEEKKRLKKERQSSSANMQIDVVGNGSIKLTPVNHPSAYQQGRVQAYGAPMRASTSGSRTPIGDEWDLDCEICGRHGPNMDDGIPMMSCGMCSKWQHIACHDHADMQAGRPKRNWDEAEFFCRQCRLKKLTSHSSGHQQPGMTQNSNPYMSVRIPPSAGAYNSTNPPAPAMQRSGSNHSTSNGYYRQQVSDSRSSALLPNASQLEPKAISFAHYQPQQRGFTSVASTSQQPQQAYGNHAPYQSYGGQSSGQQYSQSVVNGQQATPSYPRSVPNNGWNPAVPAQAPSYPNSHIPNPERPVATNYGPDPRQYAGRNGPPPQPQWQQQPQPPAQMQNPPEQYPPSQYKYYPTSYQTPST